LSTRIEKILVYSALAIIIIMSYTYAASVPKSNTPGGFDYSLHGRATERQAIYVIIGLAVIVGIVYFLSKR
jgi:cell division protein FtsW (lipid II flippase)